MIDEAHNRGLRVFLSNFSASHVDDFVTWGIDGFFKVPRIYRDTDGSMLTRAGQAGLPFALTFGGTEERYRLGTASAGQLEGYRIERHNALALLKHGAVPIFGADLGDKWDVTPRDVLRINTELMTGIGLSREEILISATRSAAQLLLGQEDLGTIASGQLADIIILERDPLVDLSALLDVQTVIKGGTVAVDKR